MWEGTSLFVGTLPVESPSSSVRPTAGSESCVEVGNPNGSSVAVLPASTEHGQTDNRGSPGTWEILSFPQRNPGWRYRVTNSRPRRRTRPPGSEKNE